MSSESFSLVVAGAMNPSIHHPMWYRIIGLLNEEEADQATQSKNTFCTPPISQVELKDFKIICQERRWEAQTRSESMIARLRALAWTVFDDILKHTPVSALGFNCGFVRETNCSDVGIVIAEAIASAHLGLSENDLSSGEIILRRKFGDGHTMTTALRVGSPPSMLAVDTNFHYGLEDAGPGFFTLKDKFES